MRNDYERLLDRALEKVPPKRQSGSRFEPPVPIGESLGNKTSIANFQEVAARLNRDPRQLLKFFAKELATSGALVGGKAIFQGKFADSTFKRLTTIFINKYVICPICKGPDTKIVKEGVFNFLICEACGARSSILDS
ncbi:MAG: translation initiation factor IF-2 subunit beta [Candidatus Bathyarchaeia archaeon]